MAQLFKNNAKTTLNGSITAGATSIVVTDAAPFGAVTSPDFMLLTLYSGSPENKWEIVKVTAISANALTVVRGQEGTTGQAWNSGDAIECRWTAGSANITLRETFSNAAYTISGSANRIVAQTGTMSAARTVTLPAASGRAGQTVVIVDESGTVTQSNYITISRSGTDTIGPGTSATSFSVFTAGSTVTLVSDGSSKWNVVQMSMQRWACTSTAAWVCPPGVFTGYRTQVGGGGGGGGCEAGGRATGGGGGMVRQGPVSVTPGSSYTCTLGAGGSAGGTDGSNGGYGGDTTWFGTTAYGGGAGLGSTAFGATYTTDMAGAYGGNAAAPGFLLVSHSTNVSNYSPFGCGGATDSVLAGTKGGNTSWGKGGSAPSGGGASWGDGSPGTINATPTAAGANTGGGGGGANSNNATPYAGGAGGSGYGEIYYGV